MDTTTKAKKSGRDKFMEVLTNEPLLNHELSAPMVQENLFSSQGDALYYGTGLCNNHSLTIGMPFDVLAMVLVAEKLRRALGLGSVFHHIADTHALCNFPNSHEAVFQRASEVEWVMQKVKQRLGLSHFTVVRSSSFDSSPEYAGLLSDINAENKGEHYGEYTRRELADMLWYHTKHGMVVKLGWASKDLAFDERFYDNEFVRHFGGLISFAYTMPGRTLNGEKKAPYIATANQDRILLRHGETVQVKLEQATSQGQRKDIISGTVKYLAAICRLYKSLGYHIPNVGSIPERVQQIINHIFG